MGSKEGVSLVKGEGTSMMGMFSITSAGNQQSPPPTTWSGSHEELDMGRTGKEEDGRDVPIHHQ